MICTASVQSHASRASPILVLEASFLNTLLGHGITSHEEDLLRNSACCFGSGFQMGDKQQ